MLLQRIEAGSTYTERLLAAEAIRVYGEHAVPRLTELLVHEDEQARQFAALGLARIGPDAVEAIPGWIAVLRRYDQAIRHDAVVALEIIGPAAVPAIPALQDLADDPDTRLADRAIFALAAMKTPEAIQALTVFLHSDERQLPIRTLLAIQKLGPAVVVSVPRSSIWHSVCIMVGCRHQSFWRSTQFCANSDTVLSERRAKFSHLLQPEGTMDHEIQDQRIHLVAAGVLFHRRSFFGCHSVHDSTRPRGELERLDDAGAG